MNEEELMRMVVRLIGDTESYQEMFQKAAEEANKLSHTVKELTRTEKLKDEAIERGAQVTRQVEKASEKYSRELRELVSLMKNGEISQETFARATKQSKNQLLSSSAAMRTVENASKKFKGEVKQLNRFLEEGIITQKQYNQQLKMSKAAYSQAGNAATKYGGQLRSIGTTGLFTVTAPLVGIGAAATKMGSDIDAAFAGVRKTVNASEPVLEGIKQSFVDAIEQDGTPVDLVEMLGIAETAGQLGIDPGDVVDFSNVVAQLKVTTNMGEEAASTMARIANITDLPADEYSNLASALVELGNNTATTEAEISSMMMRIAAAGTQAGMSVAEIAGFSAALSSVGIEAEAGGTAFSKLFRDITSSIALGGSELEAFASVSEMTMDKFSEGFRKDAAASVQLLLRNLGKLSNEEATVRLQEMGVEGGRMSDAMLRAALSIDKLDEAIEMSSDAYAANTALADEAAIKYSSFASQVKNLWAQIKILGGEFFEVMEPALRSVIVATKGVVGWFSEMSDSTKLVLVGLGLMTAAIPPLLIAIGSLAVAGGGLATMYTTMVVPGTIAFSTATGVATLTVAGFAITLKGLAVAAGMAAGAIGAIGIGVWVASEVGKAVFGTNELNRQLKESARLASELEQITSRKQTQENIGFDEIEDPTKKVEALTEALDLAEKNAHGLGMSAQGAQSRVDELSTTWNTVTGNKLLEEAQVELDEISNKSSNASARVQELRMMLKEAEEANVEISVDIAPVIDPSKVTEASEGVDKIVQKFESDLANIGVSDRQQEIQKIRLEMEGLEEAGHDVTALRQQIGILGALDLAINIRLEQERVDQLASDTIESLQQQIGAIGLEGTELELFNLENLGLGEEALAKIKPLLEELEEKSKMNKQAKADKAQADKLIEQFLPPKDKLEKKKKELQRLFDEGLINQSTFDAATKDAESQLKDAENKLKDLTGKDHDVNLGVKGLDAIEAGSAEALARVQDFLDVDRTAADSTVPSSTTTTLEEGPIDSTITAQQDQLAQTVIPTTNDTSGLDEIRNQVSTLMTQEANEDSLGTDIVEKVSESKEATTKEGEDTLLRIAIGIENLLEITENQPTIELATAEL